MPDIFDLALFAYSDSSDPPNGIHRPGNAEPAVGQAKADLARRKGIDKDKIAVVATESVDWPDTSLGYTEPEMMYAQVITPGYKILLSYEGKIYEYHSGKEDRIVYCESRSS